jgi:prepilin-type N-terminal cleavage/methylation domain-containing protein
MSNKGFTLIETLVSTGLIAIISTTVAVIMFVLLRSVSKAQSIKEVKESGEAALSIIERSVHDAVDLQSCGVNLLVVNNRDGSTTSFYCDPGNQQIASDSATGVMYITSDKVRCSSFSCLADSKGNNYLINLSFYLEPIGGYFEEGKIKFSSKIFLYRQN